MIDAMANHATRVRSYIDRHGVEAVEDFIDACLSLENMIDYHAALIERQERRERAPRSQEPDDEEDVVPRFRSKPYMERYINPPAYIEEQKTRIQERSRRKKHFPEAPHKDVLQFLLEHAPLENWERDVLAIVRDEAHYFAPQAMTKVLNEGWASYWHSAIMTQRALSDAEVVDFADQHSGALAMAPGRINPYKIIELFATEDRNKVRRTSRCATTSRNAGAGPCWARAPEVFEVRRARQRPDVHRRARGRDFASGLPQLRLRLGAGRWRVLTAIGASRAPARVATNLGQPIIHAGREPRQPRRAVPEASLKASP
jgi:spore cortex formation protein SpoVR/YcgB (stage V sporulation)